MDARRDDAIYFFVSHAAWNVYGDAVFTHVAKDGCGWVETTGRYSRSGGPRTSTQAWKNTTERSWLEIISAYSPRSGGTKGATVVTLSNTGDVGRDRILFNLDNPLPSLYMRLSFQRWRGKK